MSTRKRAAYGATLAERLLSLSHATDSGCREWHGSRDPRGYGRMRVSRRVVFAHRVSYAEFVGPIFDGLTVDHLCFNRACIEPSHLQLLTHSENARRQRRALATACGNGHEWTTENTAQTSDGRRRCRQCQNAGKRRRYTKATPRDPITECRNGHAFTPENTYADPTRGKRGCRTCRREQARQYRLRQVA